MSYLTDQLAGALDQSDEDVESPAAEPNRLLALQQELSRREQEEGRERDRVLDWGGRASGRLESILVYPRAAGRAFALRPVPNLCPCPSQQLGVVGDDHSPRCVKAVDELLLPFGR